MTQAPFRIKKPRRLASVPPLANEIVNENVVCGAGDNSVELRLAGEPAETICTRVPDYVGLDN